MKSLITICKLITTGVVKGKKYEPLLEREKRNYRCQLVSLCTYSYFSALEIQERHLFELTDVLAQRLSLSQLSIRPWW